MQGNTNNKAESMADKRVTWSDNLINIKVMTPQTSVNENLADITIYEEEEDVEETMCNGVAKNLAEASSSSNDKKSKSKSLQEEHRNLEMSLQQIFGTNLCSTK